MLGTPPAFILSQDQTLRKAIPISQQELIELVYSLLSYHSLIVNVLCFRFQADEHHIKSVILCQTRKPFFKKTFFLLTPDFDAAVTPFGAQAQARILPHPFIACQILNPLFYTQVLRFEHLLMCCRYVFRHLGTSEDITPSSYRLSNLKPAVLHTSFAI